MIGYILIFITYCLTSLALFGSKGVIAAFLYTLIFILANCMEDIDA